MGQGARNDLVVEIARELELDGISVRVVDSIPPQQAVDVSWAAKRAGRLIGERVATSVTRVSGRPDGQVAVVVVVESKAPSVR